MPLSSGVSKLLVIDLTPCNTFIRSSSPTPTSEVPFLIDRKIGDGVYKQVFSVIFSQTGKTKAISIVKCLNDETLAAVLNGIWMSQIFCDCPYILPVTAYEHDPASQMIYTLTEECTQGTFTQRFAKAPLEQILGWIDQLEEALQALRDKGLSHGDLKGENVLITENQIRVIDLDWAVPQQRSLRFFPLDHDLDALHEMVLKLAEARWGDDQIPQTIEDRLQAIKKRALDCAAPPTRSCNEFYDFAALELPEEL